MRRTVSPPMKLILAATIVGSVVVLLRPEPVDLPLPALAHAPSAATRQSALSDPAHRVDRPWSRRLLPEPTTPQTAIQQASGMPPLPPPGMEPDAGPIPPLPPLPAAPIQPDLVYLGRMIEGDRTRVFFASNGEPVVVGAGDVLNGSWRIQAISTTDITLRHLQTGKARVIAMSDSAGLRPGSATAQVGQRFLASQLIQRQQAD